jgi:hypothetical protein
MANGSILIMGGEDNNSGNEQPNLEVLPRIPGGDTTVYLQFLADTYPFNLYPFLMVLPSGNLFTGKLHLNHLSCCHQLTECIVYYNQARILDKTTFNTVSVMPSVPADNGFDGGRTYPYSGAYVIMPMTAPYNAPMQVLVCGGASTENVGLATCASITPEVPGAQWVVEWMVSPCRFLDSD